jgi:DNA-binding MarR family transcriptional regulator
MIAAASTDSNLLFRRQRSDVSVAMDEPDNGRSELATRLEHTFQLLHKRIYLPSVRHLRMKNPGLDKASVPLLATLDEHGDVRPSDAAAALELDLSTVSRQLHQLEQLGLVTRRRDGADGRASRISLTEQGRQSLAFVKASRAATLDAVFGDWPEDERRQLLNLLDRLLAGLAALPVLPGSPPVPAIADQLTNRIPKTRTLA